MSTCATASWAAARRQAQQGGGGAVLTGKARLLLLAPVPAGCMCLDRCRCDSAQAHQRPPWLHDTVFYVPRRPAAAACGSLLPTAAPWPCPRLLPADLPAAVPAAPALAPLPHRQRTPAERAAQAKGAGQSAEQMRGSAALCDTGMHAAARAAAGFRGAGASPAWPLKGCLSAV